MSHDCLCACWCAPPPGCMLLLCNLLVEKMSTPAWLHVVVVQPRRHHHSAGHHPGDATTLGECTPPRTGSSNDGGVRLLPASLSTKGSSFPGRCCDPLFSEFGGSSIYVCLVTSPSSISGSFHSYPSHFISPVHQDWSFKA